MEQIDNISKVRASIRNIRGKINSIKESFQDIEITDLTLIHDVSRNIKSYDNSDDYPFDLKYKYQITAQEIDSPAFFSVRETAVGVNIILNKTHTAYPIFENLIDTQGSYNKRTLLLLLSWARLEKELPTGKNKEKIQRVRDDWGRTLRDLIRDHE